MTHLPIYLHCAGSASHSLKQQQALCSAQRDTLLTTMGAAIRSVSHLHLVIEHQLTPPPPVTVSTVSAQQLQCLPAVIIPVPADLAGMANALLATLAPAMPKLLQMSLGGCISRSTVAAYSSTFAQLRGVMVEALCVPVEVVQYLCPLLPKLAHFQLMTQKGDQSSKGQGELNGYVALAFAALHSCTQLTRIDLAFARNTWLGISAESWDVLPDSFEELQCTFAFTFSHRGHVASLRRRVKRLVLSSFPFNGLDQMRCQFPLLQQLTVRGGAEVSMECCSDRSPDDIESLRRIFDGGLVLSCSSLKIEGKCRSLRDLLEVMPPLPATVYVTLGLRGKRPRDFCLEHVARVFPNLKRLTLMDDESLCRASPMTDEGFVAPLLKCRALERLQLSVQLSFNTASLKKFCSSLPRLLFLFYFPWEGVDDEKLKAEVQATRPGFEFKPCVGYGHYAHPAGAPSLYV